MIQNANPVQTKKSTKSITDNIKLALTTGMISPSCGGQFNTLLEDEIKKYTQCRECVTVSSCTSGLLLVLTLLRMLNKDEAKKYVITPTFTFKATITAVLHAGLTPLLIGCNNTGHICSDDITHAINQFGGDKILAILGTDTYGLPLDVNKIYTCTDKKFPIILDSAQSLGAKYTYNNQTFNWGNNADYHIFSLSPSKIVTACEGGLITINTRNATQDKQLLQQLKNYGVTYENNYFPGLNARLSELHACVALETFKNIDKAVESRYQNVTQYLFWLSLAHNSKNILEPIKTSNTYDNIIVKSALNYFVVKDIRETPKTEWVKNEFKKHGIEIKQYFNPCGHKLGDNMQKYAIASDTIKNAEDMANRCITVPIHEKLTPEDLRKIGHTLATCFNLPYTP